MTHDELLAKIDSKEENYYADTPTLDALRAIIELHKPYGQYCEACIENGNDYPCETIQAIEKELNG